MSEELMTRESAQKLLAQYDDAVERYWHTLGDGDPMAHKIAAERLAESLVAGVSRLADALTAAQAEAERVKAPVMCSVCCGQPLKSGRECICGGTGTEQAEMHGLRVECFRLEDENATLRAQLAAAEARGRELEYFAGHRLDELKATARAEGVAEGIALALSKRCCNCEGIPIQRLRDPEFLAKAERRIAARVVRGMTEQQRLRFHHTYRGMDPANATLESFRAALARAVEGTDG